MSEKFKCDHCGELVIDKRINCNGSLEGAIHEGFMGGCNSGFFHKFNPIYAKTITGKQLTLFNVSTN